MGPVHVTGVAFDVHLYTLAIVHQSVLSIDDNCSRADVFHDDADELLRGSIGPPMPVHISRASK